MSDILLDEIPSLDLADFEHGDAEKKAAFVKALGDAYNTIGFVAIKNHKLPESLVDRLYKSVEEFFLLEDEVKQKYENPELQGQRGYVGKGKESAKGRKVGDLKEFYHVGQEVVPNEPLTEGYPDNVFPEEVPDFKAAGLEAFGALEETGKLMLRAIALYLGLDEAYFELGVEKGNSILRAIHYFPIEDPSVLGEGAVRAAEHGDINLITLLMGASAEGLQVLRRDGEWIPITALPGQLVVNVGDMLDRLTNHKLKSTIHRVVNPPAEKLKTRRFSIPFFMHPRSEMDLTCLESCVDEENPKRYSDMTAGEFLQERLEELGFGKGKGK
ncbi:2-oxoglutarate and iron-dependent oxygenase domain-containing protein [Flammeovirgaceae bacterium SG7u.111]|nr:2-oxoglutarate and iron-dependent oxygenase domain-containing protein [Flammeovirgaceae bacterium SG7u.132]WPO33799.1 2-oxoglutarate and iron-dependent oxygenase domain-containing protein [Flammeovirgaceae bacterium SG7u.111]